MADVLGITIAKQHKQIQQLVEENKKLKDTIDALKRENAELHTRLIAKNYSNKDAVHHVLNNPYLVR